MQSYRSFSCPKLVSGLALAASCLGALACKQAPPAQSADSATSTAAAEGAPSAAPGELRSSFAGVMPRGLTTVGVTEMADALYLVGGYHGSPHDYSKEFQSGQVHRLQLSTGAWEELAPVQPIQSPALANDGKHLYKIGGMKVLNASGQPTELRSVADCERYDPATNRWEPLPSLPQPRSSHQAAVVDGKLYVVGGWSVEGGMNDNTWHSSLLTADLSQPELSWTSVEMPFQVRAQGLAAFGGSLYVLGGLSPEGSTDAVHRYDLATGQWHDAPALPDENVTARAAVYKGRLYANGADGSVYRLSADGAAWERAGAVQHARLFHEMVASERGPLVLAGIPNNNRGARIRVIERLSDEPPAAGVVLTLPNPSPAKNRQGAFLWSQQLFLMGGNDSLGQHDFAQQNFVSHATRLDLGALEWRPVPAFPAARQSLAAVVVGKDEEAALVLGGFGYRGEVLSTHAEVFRHDIMQREWSAQPELALPEGRSQFGLAEHDGALWVFGGMNFDATREQQDQIRHTTQILRLEVGREGARFEDAGVALKEPRRAFAGAAHAGTYYMVGGLREDFQMVQSCEAIDLAARQSKPMTCPKEHRLGAELVPLGGKLYLLGGSVAAEGKEREHTALIEVYEPALDRWAALPTPVPFETTEQMRAFAFRDQLLLYSAHRSDASAQVALLDPEALAAGRQDFTRVDVPAPPSP